MAKARFEGDDLDGNSVTIKAYKGPIDTPLVRGETVRVTIVGKVLGVSFVENQRNGRLVRDHTIKVVEIESPDE